MDMVVEFNHCQDSLLPLSAY